MNPPEGGPGVLQQDAGAFVVLEQDADGFIPGNEAFHSLKTYPAENIGTMLDRFAD